MAQAPLNSLATGDPESLRSCEPQREQGPYPLTHTQEGLWFVEQLVPGTPAYNVPEAWLLKGRLDHRALQQSLDQIVARHETLRTFFRAEDGKPRQYVLPGACLEAQTHDLRGAADGAAALRQLLDSESRQPFNLGRAPLARVSLFQMGPEEHVLLINAHHLIWDAWSQRVFIRELVESYTAIVTPRSPALPELPIEYADYALWQGDLISSEFGSRHLAYWQNRFPHAPEPVLLPADHARSQVKSFAGATDFHLLSGPLVQGLKELSRQQGVTTFITLLAAFKTLLHRYTGNERIAVGSPMAGRGRVELEPLLGFFVHTQVLETDLSGDPVFTELLSRVREVVLGGYEHQEVPCDLALQARTGQRSVSSPAPYQVVFGWQNASPHNWSMPGLRAEKIELDTGTAKFDWTVLVTEEADGLHLRSEYSTELFEPATIARMIQQFETLLRGVVEDPNIRISQIPLQSEAQREQMLRDWSGTTSAYQRDQRIHEVFEAQVAKNPGAVALRFRGQSMSYKELDDRANQLARHLHAAGVRSGDRVGICLERSFELIVGLLAILKAGAVYVPLDSELPPERLEFMIKDAALFVVLTVIPQSFKLSFVRTLLCLDKLEQEALEEPSAALPASGIATDPAYVMYTSGSTGKPKGTVIPHRGVVRLVRNTNYWRFTPGDVFLQLAPVTFDASTLEIWGPLLNGGRLVIFPPGLPSLEELGRAIRDEAVTVLWLTAGLFHQMVDEQLPYLRQVKCLLAGGDVLSPAHVAKAVDALPNCQLINGYGPTENTTFTCYFPVPRPWPAARPVPIGRPIANTSVYVLDKNLAPVPVGVPGELYTGGDGLALEYLSQPELTQARFIANPFATGELSRLYRTGDIVRWLADGTLEFIGRADNQVKIRGYRVEPGEVENVLAQHPAVKASVVAVREDPKLGRQLVAYLVPQPGCDAEEGELRKFIGQRVPAYMVPAHFVTLGELPLTANGKVDRRALPSLDRSAASPQPLALPQTPTERLVADIWCEVLGRTEVGVDDDFFSLGGHSLLATQVISRVGKVCRVELPVLAIFEAPTIARLALEIERAQSHEPETSCAAIEPSHSSRAAELLARLDEFSETELEELLQDPELKSIL